MAVVDKDFHNAVGRQLWDSWHEGNKKVAEISLSDQILLFIVQREAIVDITGTLKTKPDSLTNQRLPGINIANIYCL